MSNQALREKIEALKLERESQLLETRIRRHELAQRQITEAWGDMIDPRDAWTGESEFLTDQRAGRIARPTDRVNGDNGPVFTCEQDVLRIQGAGEWIAQSDSVSIGHLQALSTYVIGCGYQYRFDAVSSEWEPLALACQIVIDEFIKRERWKGSLDTELFRRTRRAGERFLRVRGDAMGYTSTEVYEPSWITEPGNARAVEEHYGLPYLNWKYGIATNPLDASDVWGYMTCKYGDPTLWEFVPVEQMSHVKINVDRNVKRGLSDFYAGERWLTAVDKLMGRTLDGAAIQASIAGIRKHSDGASDAAIRGMGDSVVDFYSHLPAGGPGGAARSMPTERFYSGKIVDARGFDWMTGPLGSPNGPTFIEIARAGMVHAARRWQMPENIATGDASNNNYASILESQSPFYGFIEWTQQSVAGDDCDVLWKVIDNAARAGRLPYDPHTIRKAVTLTATPPDVKTQARKEQHDIRREEHAAGILSPRTWAEEAGRDYDEEVQRGAKAAPAPVPTFGVPQMAQQPVTESRVESLRFSLLD
jgi:hypothetical protein